MLRLPPFELRQPGSLDEAASILAGEGAAEGGSVRLVAGGTDLFPNMKRRQTRADTVVSLRSVPGMDAIEANGGLRIGATATLDAVAANSAVRARYPALAEAVGSISTPTLRNMGTLGGNLCIDTRCNYLNQSEEWRCAVDFCMKERGEICWVAPSSDRCWATSSCDSAPILAALGAQVRLVGPEGERELAVSDLYRDDGIEWLTLRRDEILVAIEVPEDSGAGRCRSAFRKLRRRGSIDFAVLSVAAAVWTDDGGVVERAVVALGAVSSRPLVVSAAAEALCGRPLCDDSIAAAARACRRAATPLDNTDYQAQWRGKMVEVFAADTLEACARGDR